MTQERFYKLLEDPAAMLPGITYEEIKTLALAYPYNNNLKTLLAMKARMDEHPEAGRSLSIAAAYSIERTRLFLLITPIQSIVPEKAVAEAVLELKPIESIQRKLDALEAVAVEAPAEPAPNVQQAPPPAPEAPRPDPLQEAIPLPGFEAFVPLPTRAAPKQSFHAWYAQFELPRLQPRPERSPAANHSTVDTVAPAPTDAAEKANAKARAATGVAQTLAERSVTENKEVVSETLAKLLARQGHKERAIAMYERLCLAMPEKSASFAAEIEKLRS